MGKDKRAWRKLVKKLRRKSKRQLVAQSQTSSRISEDEQDTEDKPDDFDDGSSEEEDDIDSLLFLSKEEWEYREEQIELDNKMKRIEKERLEEIEKEKQRKIREEWEEKLRQEAKRKEEKERMEKLLKEKQEADFNEFLGFLSGDIETPPTRFLMPETSTVLGEGDSEELCYYFGKTAACRFGERCTKLHPRPTLSTAILIPNFFSHFKLEHSVHDEYDADVGLEYEDKELYQEFLEFYEDVVPELRKSGTLKQFKACCNLEPHLRGNVYIQFETIREAVEAFRKFNGRFYNGKQLSLQFIKMDSWRSAICGSFLRKACAKGRTCNFLHVFRNPTKEFVQADRDWKETIVRRSQPSANNIKPVPCSNSATSKAESSQSGSKNDARRNKSSEIIDNATLILSTNSSTTNHWDSEVLSKSSLHKREKHSKKKKRKRSPSSDSKKHKKRKKEKKKKHKSKKHKSSHTKVHNNN